MSEYVAAIDFGSAKVALAIGERTPSGIRIVSYHDAPSAGIECGEITNDSKVEEIVRSLVEQAQADISETITDVTVGISAKQLHNRKVTCSPKRKNPKTPVSPEEIQ